MSRGPKSGVRKVSQLFPSDGDLDEKLVDRIRVFYQRMAAHLRELEAYKFKNGICVAGISCTRKAVANSQGTKPRLGGRLYACAHHVAAQKAGLKLRRWQAYESEYGRLRKEQIEEEKEQAAQKAREVEKKKAAKAAPRKKAA